MIEPGKWWWGLLPLAVVWVASNLILDGSVEDDLSARTLTSVENLVHDASVTVAGRDAVVKGTIFSAGQAGAVEQAALSQWGVRKVAAEVSLPPVASPFGWSLAQDGDAIVLAGSVPDPASRAALAAAVTSAFPDAEIRDETIYASGAPAGWSDGIAYGIGQIGGLDAPTLSVSDTAVSITGAAPTIAARDALLGALGALPSGFTLASAEIAAPEPYGFNAALGDGALTLSGGVPGEDVRGNIVGLAQRLFAGVNVVDDLEIAADAPSGFADAIASGLAGLSRLSEGRFSLSGTEIALAGQARYEGALAGIRDALAGALPTGFAASFTELSVAPVGPAIDAAACQVAVNSRLENTTILFETGSARISSDSAGVLDQIVGTLARCADARVEVAGHTDSSGDVAANVALSLQRAEAVVAYMTAAGLPPANFAAIGYGPAQPVAGNETEEGRARNRRIEFIVQ